MAFTCKKCNRPVVSRKHGKCGYCGEPLGADQLMSEDEKEKVEDLKEEDKKRHKAWKEQNPSRTSSGGGFETI